MSGGPRRSLGPCIACGKVRWPTRASAKKIAREYRDAHMNAYRCGDSWHVGHLPIWVLKGEGARG